ncbi:1-phosphofructokinase [Fusobacterium sp.]|uniref:1-phosphofructokinase n=1 Tax=Fusobacterium sp. TaxID=68766 RepID=UPI0029000C26|nr:1-phosphofructokinase [Fusobacterium sp.]MDU1910441.1 1-phosphofructokinase [Fusobacterium sp.]
MIYTVTLNPAIDYYIVMDKFIEGELNSLKDGYTLAGGKGINVSKVLKNFRRENIALGFVGGFTGDYIKNSLKAYGVEGNFVELTENTRINIKMKTEEKESEISGKSPVITAENEKELLNSMKKVKDGDVLVLSGSVPKTMGNEIYKDIIKGVPAGVKVILDTRDEPFKYSLEAGVYLTKPNRNELSEIFDKDLKTIEEIMEAGEKLRSMGSENVIVSMGKDGSMLITESGIYLGNAPIGKLVSSVGAGDSMVAGIIYGITGGYSIEDSYKYGIASGSATAFSEGLTTLETMENLLKDIKIKKIK